ncbi:MULTISPECIES: M16 family metallopeptidase [Duncaniella]|uniref:Insulinase family protein n=1 Tax=Duncaniella dubosii TaxID=2518971 RepID=A0A4P7VZX9_9BACT|nr:MULTISPECIES: M16 family metallopeptidase [Duncaniella]MCX4284025.1 insulinase family protein [Duncaniella dubosii]QCD41141.1 insulinase family protein [Duncaniella dubosii]
MKATSRLMSVLVLLACVLFPGIVRAQGQNPMLQPLPVDTAVRIGKLPNGLTYYIRHNEYPKGQADFYIAQNVGSILEEDNQRGLAHFLEHMCFNGTTNFPDNQLREWLESIGVKFGANLNAYTGVDETVYNINNVPVARESVQDSCLLILHDWANDLTLDPKEIDKERGVIHEEWRRSMQGQMRIIEKLLPIVYPTSKYGHRLPIGTMEVVDNFAPQALRDYYEKWYRPDQQAVVVVGDIDVDRIEGKIKEMFSSIEMPENAAERKYEPVPDHKGTIYAIGSDPEQKTLIGQLMFISDPLPKEMKNTPMYYAQSYIEGMIGAMINNRLSEISSKPDAPFAGAGVNFGGFFLSSKVKDALTASAVAKGNDIIEPLKAVYREVLRAQRGGFTQSEYERARNEYISSIERVYNNRNTRENSTFVSEYVGNFKDGDPIPGIEAEWPLIQQIAMSIPVQVINQTMSQAITPDNRVLMVLCPEAEGMTNPTEQQLADALASVDAETIEAFVDEVKSEPLIPSDPVAGTVTSTVNNEKWGTTEWTLSNGAKVIIKSTKFKEDEILFTAYANGGYADYSADYDNSLMFLPVAMQAYGLGSYTNTDLSKYTAGKQASLYISFSNYSRSMGGSATPKDLPTLMEMVYMGFKDIEFTEDEFAALQKAYSGILANQEKSPEYIFQKSLLSTLYDSPRNQAINSSIIEKASRNQILEVAHAMTANAADWTFIFVGNVDPATLRPMVEKYIASLPGDEKTAVKEVKSYNPAFFMKGGDKTDTFSTPMSTPQTHVAIIEKGDMEFTPKNSLLASIAGQILTNRLIKTVREDMGAVYSISASGQLDRTGLSPASLMTSFPMKPEMKDEVLPFIKGEFKAMETNVTPDELNPIKEYMVKVFTENREKNPAWRSAILGTLANGVDTFNGNVDTVNSITVQDVMDFMKALNAQNNYRVVILAPEK